MLTSSASGVFHVQSKCKVWCKAAFEIADMSERMIKAPIFYMIGQVRFNPVLRMADFIGDIQGDLRQEFPDFSEQQIHIFEFQAPTPGKSGDLITVPMKRWHFKNAERTAGYILAADSLSFHTTAYKTSDDFMQLLLHGLKVVNERVVLSYMEGLGVRSLDALVPTGGRDLSFYIRPNLVGLYGKLDGEFSHSIFETVVQKDGTRLTSRAVTLKGRLGISADLAPITLQIRPDLLNLEGVHIVLDNDCIQNERISFDYEEILRRLMIAKRSISNAFYAAVTDEAVSLWRSIGE